MEIKLLAIMVEIAVREIKVEKIGVRLIYQISLLYIILTLIC